ncbi:MAG: hypothetical protein R3B47_18215 [Bacteroidia bacterium]
MMSYSCTALHSSISNPLIDKKRALQISCPERYCINNKPGAVSSEKKGMVLQAFIHNHQQALNMNKPGIVIIACLLSGFAILLQSTRQALLKKINGVWVQEELGIRAAMAPSE